MEMVAHQRPCQTARFGFPGKFGQPPQKIIPVKIIFEDRGSFDSAGHDVMQCAGSVYAGLSGHEKKYIMTSGDLKLKI
jgi:hypothetical protein